MIDFQPPSFRPHPLLLSGHLQTIASVRVTYRAELPTVQHAIDLPDGDALMLHEDRPPDWVPGQSSVLLVHGLCGCHAAAYMVRLADRFFRAGVRVFRMDLRGCGAGAALSSGLNHAGRSDDLMTAMGWIANRTGSGPLGVAAISLGGNQLLRGLGRVGMGADPKPYWFDRLHRAMAVAPPIDLLRCAVNLQRWVLWPYNRYFVRMLLARAPLRVRERQEFQTAIREMRPRTLRELDERITAPLSGFRDAADYYHQSASASVLDQNPIPTLILAAADDPIVPVGCFTDRVNDLPPTTKLMIVPRGGHVGFIERAQGKSAQGQRARGNWMDEMVMAWFQSMMDASPNLALSRQSGWPRPHFLASQPQSISHET